MKLIFSTFPSGATRCTWALNVGNATPEGVRAYCAGITQPALVALDFESYINAGMSVADTTALYAAARQSAPTLRLTSYSWPCTVETLNRDQFIAYYKNPASLPSYGKIIGDWVNPRKAAVKNLDALCPDVYLQESAPTSIERDLIYCKTVVTHCHKNFAGKPVYLWCWANYARGGAVIDDATRARYVDAMLGSGADGVVCWGEESGELVKMLLAKNGN